MISRRVVKPSVALVKLQELCARSEQCSDEILTKLRGWSVPESAALKILALLKRDRYVDDRRYVEAFVRDKIVFNRWGRAKIKLALIKKHITADLIADGFDTIDPEEYQVALDEVLQAKARRIGEINSYESRVKLLKHAASRGFEVGLAGDRIKKMFLK